MNAPSLRRLAGRPGERAVEEVEDAAEDDEDAGERARPAAAATIAATTAIPKPIRVSAFGVSPSRPEREGDRRGDAADAVAELRADDEPLTRRPRSRPAAPARPRTAAWRAANAVEGLGHEPADRLAADPAGRHEARGAEPAEVPRDERLGQADLGDELGDARLAVGEAADDPQPVHVGEGLVDEAQLAQVVGLDDGGRDRRADAGGRGDQGTISGGTGNDRINDGLYQWRLMLFRRAGRCQHGPVGAAPADGAATSRQALKGCERP